MAIFNIKLSGNKSYSMTSCISKVILDMNLKYLRGRKDFTVVVVEYIALDLWVIGGVPLSEQDKNCFVMNVSVSDLVSTEEKKRFIHETFKALNLIVGDLHPDCYINISQVDQNSFSYNRPFN